MWEVGRANKHQELTFCIIIYIHISWVLNYNLKFFEGRLTNYQCPVLILGYTLNKIYIKIEIYIYNTPTTK